MSATQKAASEKPPFEVVAACLAILIGAAVAIAMRLMPPTIVQRSLVPDACVMGGITALIVWGLLKRQNWLRWLLLITYVFGAVAVTAATLLKGFILQPLLYLHAAIQCLTFVLLILPESSSWFADQDEQ